MSARYAKGATLASEIQARLAALARAHDLTRPSLPGVESKQTPTTVRALIEAILAPYLDNRHQRLSVTGPDAEIQEQSVTSLALVLYELATNAVKCGAFSVRTGSVHIDLSVASGKFELQWKERGGPEVPKTPDHQGFGTNLIRRIVSDQFAGEAFFDWNPEGLIFRLTAPSGRVISVATAHLDVASTANANGPASCRPTPHTG